MNSPLIKVRRQLEVLAAVASLLTVWPCSAAAQPNGARLGIHVTHDGRDAIGRALAYTLREEVRRSARYRDAVSPDVPAVAVHLASIEATPTGSAPASAVSVAYTRWGGPSDSEQFYVASEILLVAAHDLELVARSLLAAVDAWTSQVVASWSRAVAEVPALCRPNSRNPFLSHACHSRSEPGGDRESLASHPGGARPGSAMPAREEQPSIFDRRVH